MKRDEKRLMGMLQEGGSPEGAASLLVERLMALEATVAEWERQAQMCAETLETVRGVPDTDQPEAPSAG